MGAGYTTIQWNDQKKRYDLAILIFCAAFLVFFLILNLLLKPEITIETLLIRALGSLAFILLHIILIIGPLSRLDPRFLILLYNRRHLGVTMFSLAFVHGLYSLLNFHTLGNENPLISLLSSNLHYDSLVHFPFEILGLTALVILAFMAFTSHDFWLKTLTPIVWKSLHMMVYPAYLLLFFHVVLGALQNESSFVPAFIVGFGALIVTGLHITAGLLETRKDQTLPEGNENWIKVGALSDIEDKHALIVNNLDERVAVFRNGRKVTAVSNICKHQGGPIGEGKIIKGCITCPWHGYQYYPHNGCSPPPFEEKLNTYNLKLIKETIYMHPKSNPEGTEVAPLHIPRK